ncbi:hypothetical protein J6590_059916, partial [Homalodisca vitripennis]
EWWIVVVKLAKFEPSVLENLAQEGKGDLDTAIQTSSARHSTISLIIIGLPGSHRYRQ